MTTTRSDSRQSISPAPDTQAPRLWLLIGDKPGDNAQIHRIATALGWPYETRRVIPQQAFILGKPRYRASLDHLDSEHSDALEPPWPDLILTVGRRPAMAALWIQAQSGGHSRVILLGRPRRHARDYALIIAPGQYRLPPASNLLSIRLPLMDCDPQAIQQSLLRWQDTLAHLPRPLTGILLGGPTKPYVFNAAVARRLVQQVEAAFPDGTLYFSTSRRTPQTVVESLRSTLPSRARLYAWSPDTPDNPYLALLGSAEQLVVTSDSISMMVEVARQAKPLAVFPLPARHPTRHRYFRKLLHLLLPAADSARPPLAALNSLLKHLGLDCGVRDMDGFHELLIRQGLAARLGQAPPHNPPPVADELPRVVAAIRALWAS